MNAIISGYTKIENLLPNRYNDQYIIEMEGDTPSYEVIRILRDLGDTAHVQDFIFINEHRKLLKKFSSLKKKLFKANKEIERLNKELTFLGNEDLLP